MEGSRVCATFVRELVRKLNNSYVESTYKFILMTFRTFCQHNFVYFRKVLFYFCSNLNCYRQKSSLLLAFFINTSVICAFLCILCKTNLASSFSKKNLGTGDVAAPQGFVLNIHSRLPLARPFGTTAPRAHGRPAKRTLPDSGQWLKPSVRVRGLCRKGRGPRRSWRRAPPRSAAAAAQGRAVPPAASNSTQPDAVNPYFSCSSL